MSIITFVGAGQMASALTFPVSENGHEVRLVGTHLDEHIIRELKNSDVHITLKKRLNKGIKYYYFDEIDQAIVGAEVVVCGVSSFGVEWFAEHVIDRIPFKIPILSVTKGMLDQNDGSMISYIEFWEQVSRGKNRSINAIGGPCTSYELSDHDDSSVVFCGRDMDLLRSLKRIFSTDYYHISLSTDIRGIECSVALKNAYALAVSLTIGNNEKKRNSKVLFYNSQAGAFQQSIYEMRRLIEIFGGKKESDLFGISDLFVTIFGGRTRKIGMLLGNGMAFSEARQSLGGITLESIVISERVARALKRKAEQGQIDLRDFPLIMHVQEVIKHQKSAVLPWKRFEKEIQEGDIT